MYTLQNCSYIDTTFILLLVKKEQIWDFANPVKVTENRLKSSQGNASGLYQTSWNIFWCHKMLELSLYWFTCIFVRDKMLHSYSLVDFNSVSPTWCYIEFPLVSAVCQWIRGTNLILRPQQGGNCVGGWLEQHDAVVAPATHQDLVLRHSSDAT